MGVTAVSIPAETNLSLRNIQLAAWLLVPNGNTGGPVYFDHYQDRSVQVFGTFAGATITIEGSNDGGTTWNTLTDPLGNALTFTAAGMKQITELPYQIRPSVAGGGVGTSVNIYLHMRGGER